MFPEKLQTTLHKKNVPFSVTGLDNLGPMQCEAPSNIAQENFQAIQTMSFKQRLVILFTDVYIRSFTSKKCKVMLSLLLKSTETNAEITTRYFTQEPVKLLVGHYLRKSLLGNYSAIFTCKPILSSCFPSNSQTHKNNIGDLKVN